MDTFACATVLARFLLGWHQEFGSAGLSRASEDTRRRYLAKLSEYRELDFTREPVIRDLAETQRSGIFEIHYAVEPPRSLWAKMVSRSCPDLERPSHLGQVAQLIFDLLRRADSRAVPYALPVDWRRGAILDRDVGRVPFAHQDDFRVALRSYFAGLGNQLQAVGLGGAEFLISMNEDLGPRISDHELSIFGPASLGFELVTGAGTLIEDVLDGSLAIEGVMLGVSPEHTDDEMDEKHGNLRND